MSPATRRGALSLLPAAVASVGAPATVSTAIPEDAVTRANRLRSELSEALNHAWGGKFGAEVFPSRIVDERWGAKFFHIRSQAEAARQASNALGYFSQLDAMDADKRAAHFAQKLRLALSERQPEDWRVELLTDDRAGLLGVLVRIHGAPF